MLLKLLQASGLCVWMDLSNGQKYAHKRIFGIFICFSPCDGGFARTRHQQEIHESKEQLKNTNAISICFIAILFNSSLYYGINFWSLTYKWECENSWLYWCGHKIRVWSCRNGRFAANLGHIFRDNDDWHFFRTKQWKSCMKATFSAIPCWYVTFRAPGPLSRRYAASVGRFHLSPFHVINKWWTHAFNIWWDVQLITMHAHYTLDVWIFQQR